jgi:hypothetical protein
MTLANETWLSVSAAAAADVLAMNFLLVTMD